MEITAAQVKVLRDATGAGMMDSKRALEEAGGDFERARTILREKGLAQAGKRAGRTANEGVIEAYLHTPDPNLPAKLGVLVELACETDFVAKTEEFQALAHGIAVHVAWADPAYLRREDVPAEVVERERKIFASQAEGKPAQVVERIIEGKLKDFYKQVALLEQDYVRDPGQTIKEILDGYSAKVGEKLELRRYARFRVGEEDGG
ncbi:MAG TPA: translation elongation factor Ts [Actinomycetota bacterium]|jgi:elongation factor Ts